jgi:ribosome-binding protein aMBF1 (putative translation factor)
MKVQTITTPAGERLVVLPEAEFHALVAASEDAEDRAAYDAVRHDLATGRDELVPALVVDRLLAGENAVMVWREHRGLAPEALARQAALQEDVLLDIEAGRREADLGSLKRLASALNVTVDDLAGA